MWPDLQCPVYLVTFTKEILNGKLVEGVLVKSESKYLYSRQLFLKQVQLGKYFQMCQVFP